MIYAIIVGAIAGWLAGKLMRGGGYGFLKNMLLGIVGGIGLMYYHYGVDVGWIQKGGGAGGHH